MSNFLNVTKREKNRLKKNANTISADLGVKYVVVKTFANMIVLGMNVLNAMAQQYANITKKGVTAVCVEHLFVVMENTKSGVRDVEMTSGKY
jgi:uncharacterized protein (DUF2252 family)